ncbi:type II toxin-antitoxin system antitoxin SocA domain-containing protein [Calothrix sp. CCY 0018]|uniref:type II toxin-antitoxin system antitoxin SocA domain-containing protein n=1 Tax=Calothrix sp. CCY 0018 TaxID=3103864 RepID=UPI0039C6D08F
MLDKLIKYFAYATKGHITKIQLIRFLYLADLYSVKWTGKQLTELNWYYYHLSPWHQDINTALDKMNGKEISIETEYNTVLIKLGEKAKTIDDLQLPLSLKLILDNIRREWAGTGQDKIKELLDYVYTTAPMVEVKDKYKPEEKVKLNLQLEREKLVSELN